MTGQPLVCGARENDKVCICNLIRVCKYSFEPNPHRLPILVVTDALVDDVRAFAACVNVVGRSETVHVLRRCLAMTC